MINIANKSLAILNSKAPYGTTAGKDALDIALIFGSFEQDVSLFFQGDGVWQLINSQDGEIISVRDYLKTFSAFEFYDIENIYVNKTSLTERNLTNNFHIKEVQVLSQSEFSKKLTSHQTVLRF
ncbi:MAG: sulfurtransferase complex subunit TusC [Litorilituus sp.]|jgi:tRNA 2-thiouridine synthesizing protein C|nr:sulfurtransferase complex subunit TusC [Litorilituus sp.]